MAGPSAESPFISYSRKDYYFAESLAASPPEGRHSCVAGRQGPEPGRLLGARSVRLTGQAACCVVIVASADSMKSPEPSARRWNRAISQKKRIIIARFRGAETGRGTLPVRGRRLSRSVPARARPPDPRRLRADPPKESFATSPARLFPEGAGLGVAATVPASCWCRPWHIFPSPISATGSSYLNVFM